MMSDRHTLGWDNGGQRRPKGVRVGTLWFNEPTEEGEVTLAEKFDTLDTVYRIDLLDDFIGLLTRERDELLRQYPDHICEALGWPTSKDRIQNKMPKLTLIDGDKDN
jgi:hypothetical protein